MESSRRSQIHAGRRTDGIYLVRDRGSSTATPGWGLRCWGEGRLTMDGLGGPGQAGSAGWTCVCVRNGHSDVYTQLRGGAVSLCVSSQEISWGSRVFQTVGWDPLDPEVNLIGHSQ